MRIADDENQAIEIRQQVLTLPKRSRKMYRNLSRLLVRASCKNELM